jgi:hypothetical protein
VVEVVDGLAGSAEVGDFGDAACRSVRRHYGDVGL